jgi:uncharacterized protein YdhG (YjbR/CyaY superfamily)
MAATPAKTIDEYIAGFPSEAQTAMRALRALVHEVAPTATERISYAMPTFDVDGKLLISFAAWKKHIGVYPIAGRLAEAFAAELAGYKTGRGSVQLPLAKPMPLALVRRMLGVRMQERSQPTARQVPAHD